MITVGMLLDPFKLFGKVLIAGFRITGYTAVFLAQLIMFVFFRRTHEIPDAFGDFGRSVTDAIAGIFQQGV